MSVPTVGPDGTVYFGQSLSYLQGVSGDFVPKWTFFDGSILSYPVVSPANDIVFTGGAPNYGVPGFVRAFSTSSGQLLWSLDLGVENGGNQNMESIPRFTPDGSTVYFGTVILGGTGSRSASCMPSMPPVPAAAFHVETCFLSRRVASIMSAATNCRPSLPSLTRATRASKSPSRSMAIPIP